MEFDWMPLLSRLNSLLLRSEEWKSELSLEAVSTGWCGSPPASEEQILAAEKRLGVTLPPSYRSFLLISNGWRPLDNFLERLLPVGAIDRFQFAAPETSADLQECYRGDDVSDEAYFDYETARNVEYMRIRYYPQCVLVAKSWGVEDDMILLNPQVTGNEGEWEAIFFANWIPGNRRYRSFYDLMKRTVEISELIEASEPR